MQEEAVLKTMDNKQETGGPLWVFTQPTRVRCCPSSPLTGTFCTLARNSRVQQALLRNKDHTGGCAMGNN